MSQPVKCGSWESDTAKYPIEFVVNVRWYIYVKGSVSVSYYYYNSSVFPPQPFGSSVCFWVLMMSWNHLLGGIVVLRFGWVHKKCRSQYSAEINIGNQEPACLDLYY